MALKTICSFKNREGKIKSIFNLNVASQGKEGKKKRKVLLDLKHLKNSLKESGLQR